MSFEIVKNLIPGLPQEAYANGVGKYVGVIAHATANNGDSVDGERSYESRTFNDAFVHFFVDDTKIEQTADTNYLAYGAGHTANHLGFVQVELCQTTDPGKFALAYAKYVWILAKVLYDRKIPVINGQTLMSHAQTSAKWHETDHTDPIQYLASHGKTWTNVVDDVTSEYKKMEGRNVSAPVVVAPAAPTATLAKVIGSLVITTKLGLNLREAANTTATVLAVVPFNTECPVIAAETGWYQIQYEGKTGWVSSQYVTYTAKAVEKFVEKTVENLVEKPATVVAPKVVAPVAPVAPVKTVPVIAPVITPAPKPVIFPAPVSPVAPVVAPVVTPVAASGVQVAPLVPTAPVVIPINTPTVVAQIPVDPTIPTPDFVSIVIDLFKDPANVLVLTQLHELLNIIFGGK